MIQFDSPFFRVLLVGFMLGMMFGAGGADSHWKGKVKQDYITKEEAIKLCLLEREANNK